jgi:hypothetical protein
MAYVWVRAADGDLVRSDVITWLRCRGGEVEGVRSDGGFVRLAGPGCPLDFHLALLRELQRHSSWPDERWVVIISSEVTADGARWVSVRLDELAETSGQG